MRSGLSKGAALVFFAAVLSAPASAADDQGKKDSAAGDLNARMSASLERDISAPASAILIRRAARTSGLHRLAPESAAQQSGRRSSAAGSSSLTAMCRCAR